MVNLGCSCTALFSMPSVATIWLGSLLSASFTGNGRFSSTTKSSKMSPKFWLLLSAVDLPSVRRENRPELASLTTADWQFSHNDN